MGPLEYGRRLLPLLAASALFLVGAVPGADAQDPLETPEPETAASEASEAATAPDSGTAVPDELDRPDPAGLEPKEKPDPRDLVPGMGIDWDRWTPSIWSGVGITSRGVDSSLAGVLGTSVGGGNPRIFRGSGGDALQGMSVPLGGRLLMPPIESLPGSPRLLLHGGYVFPTRDWQRTVESGSKPSDWWRAGVTPVYAQQEARSQGRWFVGAGAAFRLPIERYEVRLTLTVNYSEERLDIRSMTMDTRDSPITEAPSLRVNSAGAERRLRELGPGLGLDVELARRMGLALGFFAETQVGIALDDEVIRQVVAGPRGGAVAFRFDDGIYVDGRLGLRLSWVGR